MSCKDPANRPSRQQKNTGGPAKICKPLCHPAFLTRDWGPGQRSCQTRESGYTGIVRFELGVADAPEDVRHPGVLNWNNVNTFTYVFVIALAAGVFLQWLLSARHIRHITSHRDVVPAAFRDKIPLDAHRKAADYNCAKTRLGMLEIVVSAALVLAWTLAGGLDLLDSLVRAGGLADLWTGLLLALSVALISSLPGLPLTIYRVFGLEQRFGFNKMNLRLFVTDLLKNTLLMLLTGVPLILLALWFMDNAGAWWWLYVWLTWLGFNLLMTWAYPAFIAPLFNRFKPLENAELRGRVEALLARSGFASEGIYVMDGSARSTHGNAYFTGLGANKRIVFFDTLLDQLSHDEIEAVLAHELGHFRRGHVKQRLVIMGTVFLLGFFLLGQLLNMPWFYAGLGVATPSTYMALILFVLVAPAFTLFLQPLFSFVSRRHEFEADEFATVQARPEDLISALVKLYRENANTLTPDPWHSAFHDSHPPAPIRIAHLNANASAGLTG